MKTIAIINPESKDYFEKNLGCQQIISSQNDWNDLLYKGLPNDSNTCYIIYTDIDWNNTLYEGFDIAIVLRRKHKILCHIILASFEEKSVFEEKAKTDLKFKFLYSRGCGFLRLSGEVVNGQFQDAKTTLVKLIEELSCHPLSPATLTDMNEMLFNVKGLVIDRLTHDLKFGIKSQKLNEILTDVSQYLTSAQLATLEWEFTKEKLTDNIGDYSKFNQAVDELIRNCEKVLVNDSKLSEITPERKHTILVLEDDPDFQKVIEANLNHHFKELLITGSAEEAIELLKEDGRNDITGIISDWRLYSDHKEKTYWQLQGYEVLDYAAKNRLIALFALTSLSDRNVHNIRNTLGVDIHLFKKQHLETADSKVQWEMMADVIKQKCDKILNTLVSCKGLGANWTRNSEAKGKSNSGDKLNGELIENDKKPDKEIFHFSSLRDQYYQQRLENGWQIFEEKISNIAEILCDFYAYIFEKHSTKLDKLASFNLELENDYKPNLENTLILRRVVLYFVLDSNMSKPVDKSNIERISIAIRGEGHNKMGDSVKKNLLNKLCIKESQLPVYGILPEERYWLLKMAASEGKRLSNIPTEFDDFYRAFNKTKERLLAT